MSGLSVAYWQKVFDENLPAIEERLHKKLDHLEELHAILMENLSFWQHQKMKVLEEEIQEMVAFLEISKAAQRSYLMESAEIADLLLRQCVENQQLRQSLEQKEKLISIILESYFKILNKNSSE